MWATLGSQTEGVIRSMPHLAANRHGHPDLDRGWAWAVLFATTLWNFILGGTIKSFGLLYVELLNIFPNNSASAVGMVGLVSGISATLVSPFAGRLSDIYSSRCMTMVGTLFTVFGLMTTAFAPTLLVAILTYGVFFGGGMGIMDGPILAMIGKYWERRRNMACGVSFAGSSVGNLALAPLIALLINTYSVRGSFIILSGLWLNGCVVGALLRPVKKYQEVPRIIEGKIVAKIGKLQEETQDEDGDKSTQANQSTEPVCNGAICDNKELEMKESQITAKEDNDLIPVETKQQICDIDDHSPTDPCLPGNDDGENAKPKGPNYLCATMISSLKANLCTIKWKPGDSEYLRFLCNRKLLLNLIVVTCGMFGYYLPVIILPAYCQELGFSLYEGAGLLSILGIVEVISRLSLSALVDLCHLKPGRVLVVSYILIGTLTQLALFFPNGHVLVAFACAHGVLGGLCMVFMSALLVDAVGVAQLGSAMGLAVVSLNMTSSMASFVAGFMQELTGSYGNAIRLSAAVYFLGAFAYLVEKGISRCRRDRQTNRATTFELPEVKIVQPSKIYRPRPNKSSGDGENISKNKSTTSLSENI